MIQLQLQGYDRAGPASAELNLGMQQQVSSMQSIRHLQTSLISVLNIHIGCGYGVKRSRLHATGLAHSAPTGGPHDVPTSVAELTCEGDSLCS